MRCCSWVLNSLRKVEYLHTPQATKGMVLVNESIEYCLCLCVRLCVYNIRPVLVINANEGSDLTIDKLTDSKKTAFKIVFQDIFV